MEREVFEYELLKESLHRCSQNNMNQASAGYNAKWFRKGGLFGAKWQAERLYSDEEVLDLLKALQIEKSINTDRIDIDKWFEQFRKK